MARSRSRRRRRGGSISRRSAVTEKQPSPVRKFFGSWWGGAATTLGVIVALWALADASGEFRPAFPLPAESAPVEFRVENKNPLLDMTNVTLVCDVETAAFDTDHGLIGF